MPSIARRYPPPPKSPIAATAVPKSPPWTSPVRAPMTNAPTAAATTAAIGASAPSRPYASPVRTAERRPRPRGLRELADRPVAVLGVVPGEVEEPDRRRRAERAAREEVDPVRAEEPLRRPGEPEEWSTAVT